MNSPMTKYRRKIGILFGGASEEHEVSIRSAMAIVKALKKGHNLQKYEVYYFYLDKNGYCWSLTVAERIIKQGSSPKLSDFSLIPNRLGFQGMTEKGKNIDVWYPALHGPNGEDGTIQGVFTLMKKPFIGSGVLGSAVGMDKQTMKAIFNSTGLPQVTYTCVNILELDEESDSLLNRLEKQIGYPCFVKPANLGSSLGISKCVNRRELIAGLKLASIYDSRLVVEQGLVAREIECAVIGKNKLRASVLGEICFNNDWYDYDTKYSEGLSYMIIPAQLPEIIIQRARMLALKSCRAIGVDGIARVDFFYVEDTQELLINEINTLPGFTSQSMYPILWQKSGLLIQELVHQIIKIAKI